MMTAITIGGIAILVTILFYNKLIRRKNQVANAMGSVDAMLKNRYDLIPNLVDTVRAYMVHERDVLDRLTTLRTQVLSGGRPPEEKISLHNEISASMRQIMVAVENYPELKAGDNFLQLQQAWTEMEDRIGASRRFYNAAVMDYNNALGELPTNLLAKLMGYEAKMMFQASDTERQNPDARNLFHNA